MSKQDDIRTRLEAATKRPWCSGKHYEQSDPGYYVASEKAGGVIICAQQDGTDCPLREKDAIFIAHAPEDIARLLAEVERLEKENQRLERDRKYLEEQVGLLIAERYKLRIANSAKRKNAFLEGWHAGAQQVLGSESARPADSGDYDAEWDYPSLQDWHQSNAHKWKNISEECQHEQSSIEETPRASIEDNKLRFNLPDVGAELGTKHTEASFQITQLDDFGCHCPRCEELRDLGSSTAEIIKYAHYPLPEVKSYQCIDAFDAALDTKPRKESSEESEP